MWPYLKKGVYKTLLINLEYLKIIQRSFVTGYGPDSKAF